MCLLFFEYCSNLRTVYGSYKLKIYYKSAALERMNKQNKNNNVVADVSSVHPVYNTTRNGPPSGGGGGAGGGRGGGKGRKFLSRPIFVCARVVKKYIYVNYKE